AAHRELLAAGLVVAERPLDLAAGVGQDPFRLATGAGRADRPDLHRGPGQLEGRPPEIRTAIGAGRPVRPGRSGRSGRTTLRIQGVRAPAVNLLAGDEALVGELLQRRVDGARACAPAAAALLLELLDDLVAVHRASGQGGEDERPDLAASNRALTRSAASEEAAELARQV